MPAPAQLPYAVLAQTHPEYNHDLQEELEGLYEGGYEMREHASRYLPKIVGETQQRYDERCRATAYMPYFGHIVDHFAAAVFARPMHVRPDEDDVTADIDEDFYEAFQTDADLAQATVADISKRTLTDALVYKRGLVVVDFPPSDAPAASRLEEERTGSARAYVDTLCPEHLINWEVESKVRRRAKLDGGSVEFDVGWFRFAVIHTQAIDQASPFSLRDTLKDTWKVWRRDDETGLVVWERYEYTRKATANGAFQPIPRQAQVALVAQGVTTFQVVPIVELCVPNGLWIGNKIGPIVTEHFQRRSLINSNENRALGTIPYVKLGTEIPEFQGDVPALVQQNPHRGNEMRADLEARGYVVLGSGDDLGYATPSGEYAKQAEDRLSKLLDEIYRVSHLMAASVSSTANSVGRSGASKAEDRHATGIVLSALGAIVREFVRRLYETIADARGEVVSWVVSGLDSYELTDRAETLDEAKLVDDLGITSATFKTAYKSELATRLLPLVSPEEATTIRDEIKAAEEAKAKRPAPPMPGSLVNPAQQQPTQNEDPSQQKSATQEPSNVPERD